MVENSDKMWSTGEGHDKPPQHSCLENPVNNMKREKDMTPQDGPPRLWESNMLLGNYREIFSGRMKKLRQSGKNAQLWMYLVVKVKSDAVKNNIP